jgi:hypothetical protein
MRIAWFTLAPLAATLAPGVASAAPLATRTADLDGDGASETITLAADGVTVTSGARTARFALTAERGAIAASGGWIAIEATSGKKSEGVGLHYKGGKLELVWRGPIGPVGVDGDYRTALAATTDGLVVHESRADVFRCDGRPALLFARGYDKAAGKLRPVRLEPEVDPAAVALRAAPVDAAPPRPTVFAALAASSTAGATDAGQLVPPRELDDGDLATEWRENKGGDGRGEFVTFRAVVRGSDARALWIAPGGAGTARPTRFAVVGKERAFWVDLPDDGGAAYRVDFPDPIGECVSVVLADTKRAKGKKAEATGFAELVVLGDADLAPGGPEAALAEAVVRGGAGAAGAADMLVRRGPAGAAAVVAALERDGLERSARARLVRVLVKGRMPAGAAAIADAMAGELEGADLEDAAAALAAMGASAVPALAEVTADAGRPDDARVAAITALGGVPGDEALAALVAAAGTGSRAQRFAVTHALGARPLAELLAIAPGTDAVNADVARGVGLAAGKATAAAADRARAVAALAAALPAAASYELRYRAIQGLAALGDDAAVATLDAELAKLPPGGETSGLHQVAALSLARNPSARASSLLLRLATFADPGVRLGALASLSQRAAVAGDGAADEPAIDQALAGVLAGDRWPELRRAAATALGTRCARAAPADALAAAVDTDADLDVRGDALAGLVACKAKGIGDRLVKLALDGEAPLPLRERAVTLVPALDDPRMQRPMLDVFARFRGAAYDSPEALALVARAAAVLGRIGGPEAADALADALADEALPELVAAAASALGELGPACPRDAIPRLRELAKSDSQIIAPAAARAAARCGR